MKSKGVIWWWSFKCCVFSWMAKKENKGKEEAANRRKEVLVMKIRHQGALLGWTSCSEKVQRGECVGGAMRLPILVPPWAVTSFWDDNFGEKWSNKNWSHWSTGVPFRWRQVGEGRAVALWCRHDLQFLFPCKAMQWFHLIRWKTHTALLANKHPQAHCHTHTHTLYAMSTYTSAFNRSSHRKALTEIHRHQLCGYGPTGQRKRQRRDFFFLSFF